MQSFTIKLPEFNQSFMDQDNNVVGESSCSRQQDSDASHLDFHPQMKECWLGLFPMVIQSLEKKLTTILECKQKKMVFLMYII